MPDSNTDDLDNSWAHRAVRGAEGASDRVSSAGDWYGRISRVASGQSSLADEASGYLEDNAGDWASAAAERVNERAIEALERRGANDPANQNKKAGGGKVKPKGIDWTGDWPFFLGILLALLKDGSDLFGIGSIPLIGTIVTAFAGILIAACLFFAGAGGGKKKLVQKIIRRLIALLAGTVVEALLFGFNLLPIETITVVAIYAWEIAGRKGLDPTKVGENALSKGTMDKLKQFASE